MGESKGGMKVTQQGDWLTLSLCMDGDLDDIRSVWAGMLLILKYEPDAEIFPGFDKIWFGSFKADAMTEDERELMTTWGWFEEEDNWCRFV